MTALGGVDMAVEEGAVHGLLGPNGAGKSTLLRVLFGLVHPDEGRAKLFGREHPYDGTVATLTGVAGFVDRPQFYPYLTARQTLQLLVQADGLGSPVDIEEVLAATGIAYSADRRLRGWSTGVRQRLGLACSLVRRPRLLLTAGKARICTSDDDAAVAIASRFSLKVDWHVRGGLSMQVGPGELHRFVCEMGRQDVSVTLLEQEVPPLTALFSRSPNSTPNPWERYDNRQPSNWRPTSRARAVGAPRRPRSSGCRHTFGYATLRPWTEIASRRG